MKYALIAVGSRGDLQPYLALGLGLQRAGHQVLIVSPQNDAPLVQALNLSHWPLPVDIRAAIESPEVKAMAQSDSPLRFFRTHLKGVKSLQRQMADVQSEIFRACQGRDALIYHPGQQGVYLIGRHLGIPTVLASPFPITSTGRYPCLLFYNGPRLGSLYNRASHLLFQTLFWWISRPSFRSFWPHGRVPLSSLTRRQEQSGLPVLFGYSPLLFPRPPEWSDNIEVTGAWQLEEEPGWTPSAELLDFLKAGPPPVYVGFGSMKEASSFKPLLDLLVKAGASSGQRLVISSGWNHPPEGIQLPPEVFLLSNCSHAWLFPQMAALVHHGGAGTVAAGLRAGKAAVIVPHMGDQPGWGRRLEELGVAPRPLPKRELSAERLAHSMTQALDPAVRQRARLLGLQMAQEDGVEQAVSLLNRKLGQSRS
ncbi:glycosyltransferase family 1 protein [bacterium]|nr:glycosyltransferase family 1 protein [bacterium]